MMRASLTFIRCRHHFIAVLRMLAVSALVAPLSAFAQDSGFPPSQIRVVVPFTAGGGTDVIMRLVGAHLSDAWKITNRKSVV